MKTLKKLNRNSPTPLQYQLKRILKSDIEEGRYKPGEKLPSEKNLVETYGVSRHVVRQTMRALIFEDQVFLHHGKGFFVNYPPIRKTISHLSSHTESVNNLGYRTYTLATVQKIINPPSFVAEKLHNDDNKKVIYIERITYLEDEPVSMILGYYPFRFSQALIETNLDNKSIYYELKKAYNIFPVKAKTIVSVRFADHLQSESLQIREGSPLIHIGSFTWSADNTIFEYSTGLYRSDRFELEMEQIA